MSIAVDPAVVRCESQESRTDATGKKLQETGHGITDVYIIDDKGS